MASQVQGSCCVLCTCCIVPVCLVQTTQHSQISNPHSLKALQMHVAMGTA